MDFSSSKCPHCGAVGQMSFATPRFAWILKPRREFAVCGACKALSPIPKPKRSKLTRRDIIAAFGALTTIIKPAIDVLTRERPKPITGTATIKQATASVAITGVAAMTGVGILEVRVEDHVTVKEAVRIVLCPPMPEVRDLAV